MNETLISEETTKIAKLNGTVIPTIQLTNINVEESLKKEGFSNVKFIGKGRSSEAYDAEFNGKDYIIRVPRIGISGIDEYRKEHAILEIIADKVRSVKIPRTHICERDSFAYVIHEKIDGHTFKTCSFEKLCHEEQENFSQSVANFFSELHAIDANEFSNISNIRWGKINTNSLRKDFEKYLRFFKQEGLIFNQREIDTYCSFVDSVTNLEEPEVLLHRDFCWKNFVVDDDMHLAGVFDFLDCSLASRALEFNYFVEINDDGTFSEPLLLKKILYYYQQASGVPITFNDIINQNGLACAHWFSGLVSTDETLNNNRDILRECVTTIKKFLAMQ